MFFIKLISFFMPIGKNRREFKKKYFEKSYSYIAQKVVEQDKKIGYLVDSMKHQSDIINLQSDITKLKSATGALRIVQKADAFFMNKIVKVFEQNGLNYWLFAGTLLGAFRHQGFIPWDDDIDIAMLREDYDRVEEVIVKEFKNNENIYYTKGDAIRIFYKGLPLQIDIFAFDIYSNYLSTQQERIDMKKKISQYNQKLNFDWTKVQTGRTVLQSDIELKELRTELLDNNSNDKPKMILQGFESSGTNHLILDYDWIFPLKEINFENYVFKSPNKIEPILFDHYKDYMNFPESFYFHHDINERITSQTIDKLLSMLEKQSL